MISINHFFPDFRATDDVGLVFLHTWSWWPTTEHKSWSVAAPDNLHMTIALIAFKSSAPLSFLAACWAHLSWTPPDCNKWWAGTYVDHYCSAHCTWSQGYTTEALAGQVHSYFFPSFKEKARFPSQAELTQVVRWKGFRGNLRTEWNEGSDRRMNVKGKGCQNDSTAFEVNVLIRIASPPKMMWSRLCSC